MTKTSLFLAGFLVLSGVSLAAEQRAPDSRTSIPFGALRRQGSNQPYRQLFKPQRPLPAVGESSEPNATGGCGMTILEADPYFDEKKVAPKDSTKYRIRAVLP